MTKKNFDIDIDFPDRAKALALLQHTPAAIHKDGEVSKHNTGIYFTEIPHDPFTGYASFDYNKAEELGYFKFDFLNVGVYNGVKDETHLVNLMIHEPDWNMLQDRSFVERLIHVGNHYDLLQKMPEPVNSIPRMAMFLAVMRPGKRHLAGKKWTEIAKTVWDKTDDGYSFKKSHAISYATLVVVHMNLLAENG